MSKQTAVAATILVIDADTDLAAMFCNLLSFNGFATLRATTGQDGIQLAQLHHPQLIVCDIALPDISGYDLLASVRSHHTIFSTPFIMLTSDNDYTTFRRSMEQGADDYVVKSPDLQTVLRSVQTQLTKHEKLTQCLTTISAKPTYKQVITAVTLADLKDQFTTIKQQPWSSLWVVYLNDYEMLQRGYGHVFSQLAVQSLGQKLYQWQEQSNESFLTINTLAYLGGNRFVIFLSASKTPDQPSYVRVTTQLKTELQHPMVINNHRLIPDIYIECISCAQLATISMLETTLNRSTNSDSGINQLSLAARLRRAMQQDELQLHFQPQVDLNSGQIIGAEVLVRWMIPGKSPILPAQFIPAAEEHGLILPLGEWILETALQQLAHWQKIRLPGISIAINLSVYQLRSFHFLERLMALVNAAQVSPVMIDLELPERMIMEDLSQAKYLLTELQQRGFSTAIDDFGSGSLSHLQYLPVNILKLDKCFVRNLYSNRSNQVIVRAIIEMARGLNISTIANGVETARELSILKQLKCHSIQGYLFSPALTAQDFKKLLLEPSKAQSKNCLEHRSSLHAAVKIH
ncbi:response regulator receiver modulated diguanylate cyclase phosphodiesterase [Leptolyngbya sp. Heron Island J]|uniref:EAL domain-containing response regulator n=1 Tax=Leptolyngbya sp. Heron Island J TaxID=1385935 RepID=UPI0003B9DAC6|nr:EAL domain-containing protein [Leptolyngbya sp. Heron Island J]ESA38871.1 response regulator receiver modulated diguanylate cyclase phosphodiesterase [Leptolyngbya sp. Heron Island J]